MGVMKERASFLKWASDCIKRIGSTIIILIVIIMDDRWKSASALPFYVKVRYVGAHGKFEDEYLSAYIIGHAEVRYSIAKGRD